MSLTLYFSGDNKKHVLVTGASGSIGKELVRYLKNQPDTDVVSLHSVANKRIDIQNKKELKNLLQQQSFDSIYHMAALNPFKSDYGTDYFDTNVQGTENLLESVLEIKKQGKKLPDVFLASSALVYTPDKVQLESFHAGGPIPENSLDRTLHKAQQTILAAKPEPGKISETLLKSFHLPKSDIYYNDSKLLAEMAAKAYSNLGVPVKIGRLVNCYGKQSNHLMNQFLAEKKAGKALTREGKDQEARDYLFFDGESEHDDVLRMIQVVAEKGKSGQAYNISSSGQFVRSCQSIENTVQNAQTGVADTSNPTAILSNQKLLSLGVGAPRTSPEQGIRLLQAPVQKSAASKATLWQRVKTWFSQTLQKLKTWFSKFFKSNRVTQKNVFSH